MFRGGKGSPSIVGIVQCSVGYWMTTLVGIMSLLFFSNVMLVGARKQARRGEGSRENSAAGSKSSSSRSLEIQLEDTTGAPPPPELEDGREQPEITNTDTISIQPSAENSTDSAVQSQNSAVASQTIRWGDAAVHQIFAVTFIAGILAGMMGIGGGMVLGPYLLHLNVRADVSSASTATMVFLVSSSVAVMCCANGLLPPEYFIA